jgi:23S rRNA pseudouridine2605 synthase
LSELGLGSRRAVEELVTERRVRVDGKLVKQLSEKFPRTAKVFVDGKYYEKEKKALYLFHKPKRCVTTLSDPEGRRCVSDFTGPLPQRVYPVGRLDYDVCGLLLLTNDGELADQLMHPRFGIEREYLARVHGTVEPETGDMIRRGFRGRGMNFRVVSFEVKLENENRVKLVGELKEDQSLITVVVTEGKKHFVKELLKASGHPVIELARVRFGDYKLGNLKPGALKKAG